LGSFFDREVLVWLQVLGLVSSPPPFLTNTLTQPRFHLKLETAIPYKTYKK
jgi:hypothetical protein